MPMVTAMLSRTGSTGPGWRAHHSPRQVPGEEVQADEVHPCVTNGRKKCVDLAVGRHRLVRPGPPELDGREAGRSGSCGPLQQRHLAEQQRAVGGEDELTGHLEFRIVKIGFCMAKG
jgi:hypothetical protein